MTGASLRRRRGARPARPRGRLVEQQIVNAPRGRLEGRRALAVQAVRLRVQLGAHAARMRRQQQHAAAQHQRLFDGVSDEQQREAHLFPQDHQLFLHAPPRQRVQRGEGLVHQQHARLHGQRARDRHALLHAAGQGVGIGVGEARQPDLVQVMHGALVGLAPAQLARGDQRKRHVLPQRLPRRQLVEFLEHHDAVGRALHRPVVQRDAAFGRLDEAGHGLEQRGLAAARRAQQDEALGRVHVKAHLMRGAHAPFRRLVFERHLIHTQQRTLVFSVIHRAGGMDGHVGSPWFYCPHLQTSSGPGFTLSCPGR